MKNFYYIAEICQNHNGDPGILREFVQRISSSGATHAKLQYIFSKNLSYRPEFEQDLFVNNKKVYFKRPFKQEYERLKSLDLSDKHYELFLKICNDNKITPLITCFTRNSIIKLKKIGYKAIKVASYDCGSHQLIDELSDHFKTIFISTGATYDSEIFKTNDILKNKNNINYNFLHCISLYPTKLSQLNLDRINFLKQFTKNVGYSDHSKSLGKNSNLASKLSILFGANIIERHVRILDVDKTKDGPVSILPEQIEDVIEFYSKSHKQKLNELKQYKYNYKMVKGNKNRKLSDEEILNRRYYRGRFSSYYKKEERFIDNWEQVSF